MGKELTPCISFDGYLKSNDYICSWFRIQKKGKNYVKLVFLNGMRLSFQSLSSEIFLRKFNFYYDYLPSRNKTSAALRESFSSQWDLCDHHLLNEQISPLSIWENTIPCLKQVSNNFQISILRIETYRHTSSIQKHPFSIKFVSFPQSGYGYPFVFLTSKLMTYYLPRPKIFLKSYSVLKISFNLIDGSRQDARSTRNLEA